MLCRWDAMHMMAITFHCSVCMPLCPRPRSPQIKDLVELVQKARMSKILQGLATLGGAITVKLNNLAAREINAGGWVGCSGRVQGAVAEANAVGCWVRFAEGNAGKGHLYGSANASGIAAVAGCLQRPPASWPPQTLPDPWPAESLLPLPLLQCAPSSWARWTCSSSCRWVLLPCSACCMHACECNVGADADACSAGHRHCQTFPLPTRVIWHGSPVQRIEESSIGGTQAGGSLAPSTQPQAPARQLRQGAVR